MAKEPARVKKRERKNITSGVALCGTMSSALDSWPAGSNILGRA